MRSPILLPVLALLAISSASAPDAVVAQAGPRAAAPCRESAIHRALDFWIGEWEVQDQGRSIGESRIEEASDGCAVLETFSARNGFTGRSLNYVDPIDGRWRQAWADNQGRVSLFAGEPRNGGLALEGETRGRDGTRVLRRMLLAPLPDGRVRQRSDRSTDDGRTWQPAYDYVYVRRPR